MSDPPDREWTPPGGPYWAAMRSATLRFDTLAQPLPAGVRAAGPGSRHLLYEAPPFTIDLHLEPNGPERLVIAGQVIETGRTSPWVKDARVTVASEGMQLCTVGVNALGEFQCHFDRHEEISVVVAPFEGQPILISLKVFA